MPTDPSARGGVCLLVDTCRICDRPFIQQDGCQRLYCAYNAELSLGACCAELSGCEQPTPGFKGDHRLVDCMEVVEQHWSPPRSSGCE